MRVVTSSPRIHADEHGLKHSELTEKLIGIFFSIYNELGYGFLESVYEHSFGVSTKSQSRSLWRDDNSGVAFPTQLAEGGLFFERQVAVPVWFHSQKAGDFRADLLVEKKIIIELKTGRLTDSFNFGPKAEFKRHIFDNSKKNPRKSVLIRGEEV